MRKRLGFVLSLGVLVGLSTFTVVGSAAPLLFAMLNGANEAPDPGDPDGSGFAVVWPMPAQGRVCFGIRAMNIDLPAMMAHIHEGPVDVAGPIVITLTAPGENGVSGGCVPADAALLRDIRMNPANYYVNVHTDSFPAGAIRGQLHP